MKRSYPLLAGLFLSSLLYGQTLSTLNFPQLNNGYVLMTVNWQDPGDGGTGLSWDYSDLSANSVLGTGVVDPSTTSNGGQFPDATHAITQAGNVEYLKITDSEMTRIGVSSAQTVISYQDGEDMLRIPMSYGDSYTDAFAGTFNVSGINYYRSGTITMEADATGTLMMPYGTVNNVLRVKAVESYQDSFNFAGNPSVIHYESEVYIWYKPGVRAPVLSFSMVSADNPPNTFTFGAYLEETAVSVAEVSDPDTRLDVFPNPATGQCNIRFQLEQPQQVRISLIDRLGREVAALQSGDYAAGSHQVSFPTEAYPSGLYYLRFQGEQKQQSIALHIE